MYPNSAQTMPVARRVGNQIGIRRGGHDPERLCPTFADPVISASAARARMTGSMPGAGIGEHIRTRAVIVQILIRFLKSNAVINKQNVDD